MCSNSRKNTFRSPKRTKTSQYVIIYALTVPSGKHAGATTSASGPVEIKQPHKIKDPPPYFTVCMSCNIISSDHSTWFQYNKAVQLTERSHLLVALNKGLFYDNTSKLPIDMEVACNCRFGAQDATKFSALQLWPLDFSVPPEPSSSLCVGTRYTWVLYQERLPLYQWF